MPLRHIARTGVSIMHGSSTANTLRALRLLELGSDLDVNVAVGYRGGDGPALADFVSGLAGRAQLIQIAPDASDAEAHNQLTSTLVQQDHLYIWSLSPDLVVGQWALSLLTKHMAKIPDCAVVGCRIMQYAEPRSLIWSDGGSVSADGSVKRLSAGKNRDQVPKARAVDVQAVPRAGALYRTAALETVGPFLDGDEVDGHDVGWAERARAAGWRTMVQRRVRPTLEDIDG